MAHRYVAHFFLLLPAGEREWFAGEKIPLGHHDCIRRQRNGISPQGVLLNPCDIARGVAAHLFPFLSAHRFMARSLFPRGNKYQMSERKKGLEKRKNRGRGILFD